MCFCHNEKIEERVGDAVFLWKNNRRESAFLLILVCVAALSRQRYPYDKDGEAFRKTVKDFRTVNLQVEFRGHLESIENIFYKWVRCELVHEAGLPFDVQFVDDTESEFTSVRAGGHPEYILRIGTGWFEHFVNSVSDAYVVKNSS